MRTANRTAAWLFCLLAACAGGTDTPAAGPAPGADLSGFETARITVSGQEVEVWLAETPAQRRRGLMFVTEAQLDPLSDGTPRGMLFLFATESFVSFWMRDTYVPLDLAYARGDGTIVAIHDLVPLDETAVPSSEPVQFALELFAGTLAALGVTTGDALVVPPSALP